MKNQNLSLTIRDYEDGEVIAVIQSERILEILSEKPFYTASGGSLSERELSYISGQGRRLPQWARNLITGGITISPLFTNLIK